MQSKGIHIWVGIFVLLGLVSVVILATRVSGGALSTGNTYTLSAKFDNVGGLSVKSPIRIGGVKIGSVTNIYMDKDDYKAVVEMAIDKQFDNLPLDTGASILTSGVLGANFVGLEPGADDFYLADGERIELTQSAIQLESLISQFMFNRSTESGE